MKPWANLWKILWIAGSALALPACNPLVREDQARSIAADTAADEVADATNPLKARIDELESELDDTKRMLELTSASLTEARENHASLRTTFNDNVDRSNRRNEDIYNRIEYLERRLGIYR